MKLGASKPPSTNDRQIRAALKRELLANYAGDPETLILEELGLRHGTARVDLVVVNGSLHGFEVKSDRDSLKRLPRQANIYNGVLDLVTLVVGHRHAEKARAIIPQWWGIKLARAEADGAVRFSDLRQPASNPSPDKIAIARLLWRDEALAALGEAGAAGGLRSKPRRMIYARLAEVVDLEILGSIVRRRLRCRTKWRSDALRRRDGVTSLPSAKSLDFLSPRAGSRIR